MEIRTFAEQILFEPDLATKLAAPVDLSDAAPGDPLRVTPRAPARAPGLAFRRAVGAAQVKFPKGKALERDEGRGTVLHFFANHELLALELMALALLRFPDAPPAFRKGVVGIMADEQRHLRFYLDRMRALGVEFGQVPLSDFFWTALRDVPDPAAFVAGMSLTLEQANLDFALRYAKAFRQVGDEATGAVLDKVLADEIRHVAHGRVWFERWKDPADDLWTAWLKALVFPMTPARAKAPPFDVGVRAQAGFKPDFINRLRVFTRSKGRAPTVHWFDPSVEEALRDPGAPIHPRVQALAADLETLPAAVAARDDVVLVRRRPELAFLADQHAAGLPVPEYVAAPLDAPALPTDHPLTTRSLGALAPWGAHPGAATWAAALGAEPVDPARRALAGKPWAAQFRTDAAVAHTLDAVEAALAALPGDGRLKAAFGTAGRHQRRAHAPLGEADRRWVQAALAAHGAVVVEPEYDRVLDLNALLHVEPDGSVRTLGVHRFLTSPRGGYRGGVVHPWTRGLPTPLARFVNGDGDPRQGVTAALTALADRVGAALAAAGHRGPAGIDALVARTATGFQLVAPLEVNPRTTLGHVARGLAPRLAPGCAGWCILLRRIDLKASGCATFVDLRDRLAEHLPLQVQHMPRPHLQQGVAPLTDPARAQHLWAALVVAPRTATLEATWAAAGLPSPLPSPP